MKLATLKDGTRDGALIIVSRNLKKAVPADHIAPTLQAALDDWDYLAPQLQTLYEELNSSPSNRAVITSYSIHYTKLYDFAAYRMHLGKAQKTEFVVTLAKSSPVV